MRILHTSDWHIGHRLYERNRIDEHRQFLDWLLTVIQEHAVDVLLVSGDIFDTALPSSEATDLYYQFLFELYRETEAQAVITAGNHDSPMRLAAPRQFLKMGRIHVIGEIDPDPGACVIALSAGNSSVAIAAVPYLSENEILPHVSLEREVEKAERYREAMRRLYQQCVAQMPAGIPKILMGHFVVYGGEESGSERTIQIGGATAVRASDLPEAVDYVALGHLHRPQSINGTAYPIRYAGSPLPMTFREAEYDKKVYLLDLDRSGADRLTEITVPVFRELCRVRGDYDQIIFEAGSADWDWRGKYIEVQLIGQQIGDRDKIRGAFSDRGGEVLLIRPPEVQQQETDLTVETLSETSPEDIFAEFYQTEHGVAAPDEIRSTFTDLIGMVSSRTDEENG
ncbi:MAG: exonuclease SbcCD subunit D C-terminal domain-containing protein [Candidatus Poribacteria bacterium]|nr:exonuclease SbcCD subunit D C-terminal domain-containing protein [Candidatus Poribacteria bacterium]